jgi:UDP-glucuronate decarboxylase
MVGGLMKAMLTEGLSGEVCNLGNAEERTILSIAELVRELTSSKSEMVFRPLPEDDPRRRKPEITKAQERLGWQPIIDLNDGLIRTIEYFRGRY